MKRLFLIVLITFTCCAYSDYLSAKKSDSKPGKTAKDYYNEGNRAYKKQDDIYAIYCYQKALILWENHPSPSIMAGRAFLRMEQYANAFYYFNKARENSYNSDNEETAVLFLAIIDAILGEDEQAWEMASKLNENTPQKHNILGGIIERKGKIEESFSYMRRAVALGYKKISLFNIGVLHSENGNKDSAVYYFDKVISIAPDFPDAYLEKAYILKELGQDKKTYQTLCKNVIRMISKYPLEFNNSELLAGAYKLLDDKKKEEKYARIWIGKQDSLLSLYPNAYPFMLERGIIFEKLGNKDAAIADFRKVLEINPAYIKVRKKLEKLMNEN